MVLFGMDLHAERNVNQYWITRNQVAVVGSFIQRTAFPKVVRILESGILPLDGLITHRLRLGEVARGFDAMRSGEAIKVVVEP